MKISLMWTGIAVFMLTCCCFVQSILAAGVDSGAVAIIPAPARIEHRDGVFHLSKATPIILRGKEIGSPHSITFLADRLGLPFADESSPAGPAGSIDVETVRDERMGSEGYMLEVTPERIHITSRTEAGRLYAVMSLLQLLPPDLINGPLSEDALIALPCVKIVDYPRFRWRGMHLDVSRHFMPKEFVMKYIDIIAFHKMNTFHWHLTDDQGWRIEIEKYPLLTSIGAWRVDREDRNWNSRESQRPGEKATYGGYYTKEEIREIVRYAAERHITIVPEIEMPAHATAALAAYPQYSCTGGPFTVAPGGVWPITDIFCAGNDSTFLFLEDILAEVMSLFPGKYIHVGGDEADKLEWKRCPKCQSRMKSLRLKNEERLQGYFMKRIEKYLTKHGRKLIGWDEILDGGLPPRATVMSWRGTKGGALAARQGHDVVMTPGEFCYFDYYQGSRESEPLAIGGFTPLSKVYRFEPVPSQLPAAKARHILGAQGNVWTEFMQSPDHVEYMILPRMAAMSEVLWSQKKSRDWEDFSQRVETQMVRYDALGYNYAKSSYLVRISVPVKNTPGELRVSLDTDLPAGEIRYTLDGSNPSPVSAVYAGPVSITSSCTLHAAAFRDGVMLGGISRREFNLHKGFMKPVRIVFPYEQYTGGGNGALVDGLRGSLSFNDGIWQGYHQTDLVAMVDLGRVMPVATISSSYLQNTLSWIFLPTSVEYSVSTDGILYSTLASVELQRAADPGPVEIRNITREFQEITARYVRVIARNTGIAPAWHHGSGQPVWLFVDELIVN